MVFSYTESIFLAAGLIFLRPVKEDCVLGTDYLPVDGFCVELEVPRLGLSAAFFFFWRRRRRLAPVSFLRYSRI